MFFNFFLEFFTRHGNEGFGEGLKSVKRGLFFRRFGWFTHNWIPIMNQKLFVWDNAIIVVADTIDNARSAACERLRHFENLKQIVTTQSPLQSDIPCVRILFSESSSHLVNCSASLEKAEAKTESDCLSTNMYSSREPMR